VVRRVCWERLSSHIHSFKCERHIDLRFCKRLSSLTPAIIAQSHNQKQSVNVSCTFIRIYSYIGRLTSRRGDEQVTVLFLQIDFTRGLFCWWNQFLICIWKWPFLLCVCLHLAGKVTGLVMLQYMTDCFVFDRLSFFFSLLMRLG